MPVKTEAHSITNLKLAMLPIHEQPDNPPKIVLKPHLRYNPIIRFMKL